MSGEHEHSWYPTEGGKGNIWLCTRQGCGTLLMHQSDLARRESEAAEKARADEREGWASWIDNWLGAVGPKPPTPEAIRDWLRADLRPWGRADSVAQGREETP